MGVEPIPGEPAAVADLDGERAVVVADYHAGIEAGLRRDGVELPSHADERRHRLTALVDAERPDRLVVVGDLGHAIGDPGRAERSEIRDLFGELPVGLSVTLAKGNHDGDVESVLDGVEQSVDVTPGHGTRLGPVGFAHGHTWPNPEVLGADVVCIGHEHPVVRLEDDVGGRRVERVWIRADLAPGPFREFQSDPAGRVSDRGGAGDRSIDGELVVCPAFNDLSGGTWVNVENDFLSPFMPEGMAGGEAYLLDGTRLGDYRRV